MQRMVNTLTGRLRLRWLIVVSAAAALVAVSPAVALAAQTTIGPPSASPTSHVDYDQDANTVTLDPANVAQVPGVLTDVRYFAGPDRSMGGGNLAFVAVNQSRRSFDWVGDQIADSTASAGPLTYTPNAQNTYTPAQTVAIPQGDALGVYQASEGIIPFDNTGTDDIVQELLRSGPAPATGDSFSQSLQNPRDYAFQGDFDPATQLVVDPAPGNAGTAPAGSLDQLQYLVSFQDASGTVVPDTADAPNIDISSTFSTSSTGATITDCHGNPITHPSTSATAGVYSFCVQVSDSVGTDTIDASDPGASSVTSGGASVTQSTPQPSQLSVAITPASLQADGSAQATVTAHLTDASGDAFPGRTVTFTSPAQGPTISSATSATDSANDATATLTASSTPGTYTITAADATAGITGSAQLTQTALPTPPPAPTPTGGGTAPPTTHPVGSAPTRTSTKPRTPTVVTYTYPVARHRAATASAKLTGCKTIYAGRGKKRHPTGTSCRLALTIKGLKVPKGSRARLTRSGAVVGTGRTRGTAVTLTVVLSRMKSGKYTLAVSERHATHKVTLQVHVT
jgi:hypothetical protein